MTIIARSTEPVLHRPDTLAEALALSGPGSVWWAGGTDLWLMIDRKGLRPEALIDLTHIAELQLIQTTEAETTLGAAVTLAELEESPLPAVAEAVRRMCTVQTRTLATLGGNLCHAAPLPTSLRCCWLLAQRFRLPGRKAPAGYRSTASLRVRGARC